jgi:hypothetical protein
VVAGTPDDWIEQVQGTLAPAGLNHLLVSFADPFTVRSWAGVEVEGLPTLTEQLELVGRHVIPALSPVPQPAG